MKRRSLPLYGRLGGESGPYWSLAQGEHPDIIDDNKEMIYGEIERLSD